MKLLRILSLLTVLMLVAACGRGPQLEVRAFEVTHLEMNRAVSLVEPYIFYDREGSVGTYSVSGNVLTVRETPDNLNRIEAVLAQYDKKKPTIMLHVSVIEADGGSVDPEIEEIAGQLRDLFKFTGYSRVAGGIISAREGDHVRQSMGARLSWYEFSASAGRLIEEEGEWILYTELGLRLNDRFLINTAAQLREGQTTLVGTSMTSTTEAVKAVILAVRPEMIK